MIDLNIFAGVRRGYEAGATRWYPAWYVDTPRFTGTETWCKYQHLLALLKVNHNKHAFYGLVWTAARFLNDLECIGSIHFLVQVAGKNRVSRPKSC
jgi:hypothetical protein